MNLNKSDLIEVLAEKTSTSKKEAGLFLDAFIDTVKDVWDKEGKISLVGFGNFETRRRNAREMINPQNPSQKIHVCAKIAPVFKASKTLTKDAKCQDS